ncbi:MAG: DUF4339 domain-containing protein [Treponema sp.]|nr:DUF4339 domain-containing protein [Treponema sp.]
MKRICLFLLLCAVLMIGTINVVFAQTPNLTGYFVAVNGQQTGPYDTNGLRQLINQGRLNRDSLVWKEGMSHWIIAGTVPELQSLFTTVAPPPLPSSQTPPPIPNQSQSAQIYPSDENYQNFSGGIRFGTIAMNHLVPGLGSFVLMKDKKGGGTNLGLYLGSIAAFSIGGGLMAGSNRSSSYSYDYNYSSSYSSSSNNGMFYTGVALLSVGGGLFVAFEIYNIVRACTYQKPRNMAAILDPDSWQLEIVPGKEGIERVSIAYTHKF